MQGSETKICKNCHDEFTIEEDDFSFYEKMKVPPPGICPDCRFKQRALWRNETTLYSGRKCNLCGKNIVSIYNPKSRYTVYCHDCYFSDRWNPKNFGETYNPRQSFFEQLNNLLLKVPKNTTYLSTSDGPNINSDFTNMAGGLKNCYLVFNSGPAEDLIYSRGIRDSRDSSDMYFGINFERCYEDVNVSGSNGVIWGKNTFESIDSVFVLNCRNVNNCFGCVNLINRSYHFFNEPLSREEYKKRINDIMGSFSKMEETRKKFEKFSLKFPHKENNNLKTENSIGDYLYECKNVKYSFEATKAEDCKYLFSSKEIRDSMGVIGYGFQSELLLECVAVGYSTNVIGSRSVTNSQNISYSFSLRNCHDCFGCDGLENVSYCILNKQYSKEEYERLREKIIEELKSKDLYGLMIPSELAPFSYNETIGQDNMPLTKDEALAQGFRWEDDIQKTEGKETIQPEDLPDHIKDVPDSITEEILRCIDCGRNYKIIHPELQFYRKMLIPLPLKCFYCRHRDRIARRGPYKFWQRNCAKCEKEITTNYAPDRPEIVYCVECYQKEVY